MKYTIQAKSNASYRRRTTVILIIVVLFMLFSAFMAVYTFMGNDDRRIFYGVGYSIAVILCLAYVIMRINSVYATYIATDGNNIYMKNWKNDFLPYNINGGIKFVNAFIPVGTKITDIPIDEISMILVGTKNFIKRYADTNEDFLKSLRELEHSKDIFEKKQVRGMDIIYIQSESGESCYMPIEEFNINNINRILKYVKKKNSSIEIKTGSRSYKAIKENTSEVNKK